MQQRVFRKKYFASRVLNLREHLNILIIVLFCFFSVSGFGRITNILAAILMVAYLIFNFKERSVGDRGKSLVCFLLFFVYKLLFGLFNIQSIYYYFGTVFLWTAIEFFPIVIAFDVLRNKNAYYQKRLFVWLSIMFFGIVAYSIYLFIGESIGGRAFVQNSRGHWIGGGYPIAYSCALMLIVMLFSIIRVKKRPYIKILIMLGCVLCTLHLFYTQSVITLIASGVGLLLFIFFAIIKGRASYYRFRLVLSIMIIVMLFLTVVINLQDIGRWLINYGATIENEVFSQRIQEIGFYITNDSETYHMGVRASTLSNSFFTFLKSPIIGSSYRVGDTYELLEDIGVGNHSEILDSLARYGILGSIPLFLVFYYQFKSICKGNGIFLAVPLVGTFFVLTLFNPFISAQTCFTLFLFAPLLLQQANNTKFI